MTIKELKNSILLALYDRYKRNINSSIQFDKLCEDYSIVYDSVQQVANAVESLKSENFVKALFFTNGTGMIHNITAEGVEYVEENLLTDEDLVVDGLRDTDKLMKSGATVDIDIEGEPNSNIDTNYIEPKFTSIAFTAKEQYKDIQDFSVDACFGVNELAECYVKQLDKIAEHPNENFRMLGIFGPWGRGKTYFFQRIKKSITERSNKKDKSDREQIKYKIIEFNAWKYQDTPAIWAYLYETIYKEGLDRLEKVWLFIKSKWLFIFVVVFSFLFIWLYPQLANYSESVKSVLANLRWPVSIITVLGGMLYTAIKNPFSTYSKIEKYFKRKSYAETLGIQNALEQDLESLIKVIVRKPKRKQILLYVDDIDRCETTKMLNVVNSLRLILENKDIQKRMIVICSVDANKLVEAYCENKYGGNGCNEEQRKEAKEHLDKLFIFSIGLAPIDKSQQIEYLEKLYTTETIYANIIQTPFSVNREKSSIIIEKDDDIKELTDAELGKFLGDYLRTSKIAELTPRKIRIIYYRLLFANNIMAHGQGLVKKDILDEIVKLSIYGGNSNLDIDTAGSDVVSMVVPY